MAKIDLTSPEWCELVFQGKNKAYGAYKMRANSPKRHTWAMVIVVIIAAVGFSIPTLVKLATPKQKEVMTEVTTLSQLEEPEVKQEEFKKVEPVAPPPALKSSIKFTAPVIKKDEEVRDDEEIKSQEELTQTKVAISIADVKGNDELNGKDIAELKEVITKAPEAEEKPYTMVEQMPQFPGGDRELLSFIAKNLRYPTIAQENGIQGKVFVRFVVSATGDVKDVKVMRSLDPYCDKEAIRVIQSLPKWIPGKQNGRNVPVYYTVPITFKLQYYLYMMKLYIALSVVLLLLFSGCGNKPKPGEDDTLTSGTITIAVDETFRPIAEEELQVFHALTPDATVHPVYCSEVKAMKLLLADSVRLAITTRQLTRQEMAFFNDKKFFPVSVKMATDGLALIVNKQNADSLITVEQFKEILTGKITDWKQLNPDSRLGALQLVFDNPNSSTVHYVLDSICGGKPLSEDLKAQKTNPEVISYVAKTPAALGVIGVNWIGNPADSTRLSFNDAIRIMAVSRADSATVENSFRPYQAYLALNQYPLTRSVYILLNDPKSGLPSGLTSFLTDFRGQRIILKSGLVPATAPVRIVDVKEEYK